jgi:DNA-directed RNA polymerase alpha subunit
MNPAPYRNEVLNPCPGCGKRFDVNGCMTFVDSFLETWSGGKCPACGTPVVLRVQDRSQPEARESATTLAEIRAFALDDLWLSVRTRRVLEEAGVTTVGQLLDSTESAIRHSPLAGNSVIAEIQRLLSGKGLSIASTS